jgi:hypothetical protein
MKLILVITAIFATTVVSAQSKTETDIINLSAKRIQWLLEKKADSLALLYDENSITVHGNGLIKTAKEQLDDVKGGKITYKSIDVTENTVKDFGNTQVLVGKGVFKISVNGQDLTYNMVYMEVYQKQGNQWKLVARQASEIH